jgi:AraC-like DNA-binding protein
VRDWARYGRAPDVPLEAMHAHFERHAYHRHSHDTYSFGVTDLGAQTFTCRGAEHTSAAGMVMAFNPDDPHDGHPADALGFTYRMVHIGPDLVAATLADAAERPVGLPLFAVPVVADAGLARRLGALTAVLLSGTDPLRRDELLTGAVRALTRHGTAGRPVPVARVTRPDARWLAARVRELLDGDPGAAPDLAVATGRSRFAAYRAFHAVYGLAPSDYARQLRLRTARRLLAAGTPIAEAAAVSGFADQSHLTRWFTRSYGITPAAYRHATGPDGPVGPPCSLSRREGSESDRVPPDLDQRLGPAAKPTAKR